MPATIREPASKMTCNVHALFQIGAVPDDNGNRYSLSVKNRSRVLLHGNLADQSTVRLRLRLNANSDKPVLPLDVPLPQLRLVVKRNRGETTEFGDLSIASIRIPGCPTKEQLSIPTVHLWSLATDGLPWSVLQARDSSPTALYNSEQAAT